MKTTLGAVGSSMIALAAGYVGCTFDVDNPALDLEAASVSVLPQKSTDKGLENVSTCLVSIATGAQVVSKPGTSGFYLFEAVPQGPLVLDLYEPDEDLVARVDGLFMGGNGDAVYVGRVHLEPAIAEVKGTVRKPDGEPAIGAAVFLPYSNIVTRTKQDGTFTLRRVPRGTHYIYATLHAKGAIRFGVPESSDFVVTLRDRNKVNVTGTVYVRQKGPASGVMVTFRTGSNEYTALTDSQGRFRTQEIEVDTYTVTISGAGVQTLSVPNVPADYNVELPPFILSSTSQADLDGDKILDDTDGDKDNDAISDEDDAFPYDRFEQSDTDGDGIGDNKDNCKSAENDDQADKDFDGVGDVCDNCPSIPNPEQADKDKNGTGDACED